MEDVTPRADTATARGVAPHNSCASVFSLAPPDSIGSAAFAVALEQFAPPATQLPPAAAARAAAAPTPAPPTGGPPTRMAPPPATQLPPGWAKRQQQPSAAAVNYEVEVRLLSRPAPRALRPAPRAPRPAPRAARPV